MGLGFSKRVLQLIAFKKVIYAPLVRLPRKQNEMTGQRDSWHDFEQESF